MGRILYVALPAASVTGGVKIAFRQVETLRSLGYDAAIALRPGRKPPEWFEHRAPIIDIEGPEGPKPQDFIVIPEDTFSNLKDLAGHPARKVVFCQNHYYSCQGVGRASAETLDRLDGFMACSRTVADWLRWRFPGRPVDLIPPFVDDTVYRPAPGKRAAIAVAPRKRRQEAPYLADAFRHAYPRHAQLPWVIMDQLPEGKVGEILGRCGVMLSLSRLEGLGLLPLEAMAAGCLVAGFTGYGGREYASPINGFWADDLDCVLRALGAAADLCVDGGPVKDAMIAAGHETAARWSRAAMAEALDAFFAPRMPKTL